jgi:hypothetical protein
MATLTNKSLAAAVKVADQARSFIVGRDRAGLWIALERHGSAGGIFASKDAAMHYAAFETDRRPGAVNFSNDPLEFKV